MRRTMWTLGLAAAACAPPDPPPPSVTIISPDADEIALDEDGMLRIFVAIDVDDFTFFPPGEGEPGESNEGHWHLYINNTYEGPQPRQYVHVELPATVGQEFAVTAALASDDHQELFVDGAPVDDTVEFSVVAHGGR